MIKIWHTPRPMTETLISGTRTELLEIKRLLQLGCEATIYTSVDGSPAPYECWLDGLHIQPKIARDSISIVGRHLVFSGTKEGLGWLASFFDIPEEYGEGYHVHHEYFGGDQYVAEDSLPLVIMPDDKTA